MINVAPVGKALHEIMPYWEIWHDLIVLPNRQCYVAIKFELPNTVMSSDGELDLLGEGFETMLRMGVPEGEHLRLYIEKSHAQSTVIQQYLDELTTNQAASHLIAQGKAERFFNERMNGELFEEHAYVLLSITPPEAKSKQPDWMLKMFGRNKLHQSFTPDEFKNIHKRAIQARDRLRDLFRQAGLKAESLDSQGCFSLLYRFWNPSERKRLTPKYNPPKEFYPKQVLKEFPQLAAKTLNYQLGRSAIDNSNYGMLWLSERYLRVLTMDNLPEGETIGGMIGYLLQLTCENWIVLDFEHVPYDLQLRAFEAQARRNHSLSTSDDGFMADPSMQVKNRELQDALDSMVSNHAHPFNVGLSLIVLADDRKQLEGNIEKALILIGNIHGLGMITETVGTLQQFRKLAPASGHMNDYINLVLQGNASDFLPLNGVWKGHEKPTSIFHNRWGTVTSIDMFSPTAPNHNGIIIGGSGQGKSFLAQTLMADLLKAHDVDLLIVDKGASYHELTHLYGGEIIHVDPSKGICINPFDLPDGQHAPTDEHKSFLLQLIRAMLPDETGATQAIEAAMITTAIDIVYKRHTTDVSDSEGNTSFQFEGCRLSDFIKVLTVLESVGDNPISEQQRAIAQNIAVKLQNWTGNTPTGRFIDGETNVNPEKRVVCFETEGLRNFPDLSVVGLMLISNLIWKRVEADRSRRKVILFEEVASLLKRESSARFIDELYRTLRKYGAAAYTVTQSLQDFVGEHAQSLIQNTSFHFFLPIPSERDLIANIFHLPQRTVNEIDYLQSKQGQYREVLAFVRTGEGFQGDIINVKPTPQSYWAFTTAPNEIVAKQQAIKDHKGNVRAAIEFLAELHPHGL